MANAISACLKIMTLKQEELEEKIDDILTNHLPHLQILIAEIKTNVGWLLKTYWIIVTASIGGLIAGIINLLIK